MPLTKLSVQLRARSVIVSIYNIETSQGSKTTTGDVPSPRTRTALLAEYEADAADPAALRLPAEVVTQLQRLVDFAARSFGVDIAAIDLLDDDELRTVAAHGAVPDHAHGAGVYPETDRYHFYAAAPLRRQDDEVLGALRLLDRSPRELSEVERDSLRLLAEQVTEVFELHRRSLKLNRAVAELTRTRAELERSNAFLGAFAGQVGHDLRSPLAGIQGYLEMASLALGQTDVDRVRADLDAAGTAAQRMAEMLDGLLDYARRGSELPRAPVAMDRVLDEVLSDLNHALIDTDVTVTRDPLPEVSGDAVQLRAVLQNLLANAIKFRHPQRPSLIHLSGRSSTDHDRISVTDNGIGIEPQQRPEAFVLLNRIPTEFPNNPGADAAAAHRDHLSALDRLGRYDGSDPLSPFTGPAGVDGVGIGLATCERIIGAHGGSIGISDGVDGGISVWFTVPHFGARSL